MLEIDQEFRQENGEDGGKGRGKDYDLLPLPIADATRWLPVQLGKSGCALDPCCLQHRPPFSRPRHCSNTDAQRLIGAEQPRQRQYGFEHRLAIEELQKQEISAVAQSNQGGCSQGERNAQQGDQNAQEYEKLHARTPVPAIITLGGLLLPPSCTNRELPANRVLTV